MGILRAPFPWFGGKSRVAPLVWQRFGDVANYVEPFAGSLAVLLGRPTPPRTETVNDADCYLSNFWRAVQADPEAVAAFADWPVNEADLQARHLWLIQQGEFRERVKATPEFFDARVAGWWVWGLCQWIGHGWCAPRQRGDGSPSQQLPHLGDAGMGVHRTLPHLGDAGRGVHRKLPHLGNAGRGVHRKLPHLGNAGRGVHRKLPHLGNAGRVERLVEYLGSLAERLRGVRVACGDWTRVMGDSVTYRHGVTGVFLDPPYSEGEHTVTYSAGTGDVATDVAVWCRENGENPLLRIALCGYEGEHEMPGSWTCVPWKAHGGYGSQGDGAGRENANRERIWFSPACIGVRKQATLFEAVA